MYQTAQRNRDRIEFAKLRQDVDPAYEQAHDELSTAYYDFWRQGKSYPWRGYDVQPTSAQTKALFDKLHGLIFCLREVALLEANSKLPLAQREPLDKLDPFTLDDENKSLRTSTLIQRKVAALAAEGITLTI